MVVAVAARAQRLPSSTDSGLGSSNCGEGGLFGAFLQIF